MQLPKNLEWLLHHLPVFPISGSQVQVLLGPKEFYSELLNQASQAKTRIIFAALYLGTQKLEQDLVSAVYKQMQLHDGLRVQWLLDFTRGSRGNPNSQTVLLPLIKNFPDSCRVSLYHTPHLRGFVKRMLPERWNEVVGLQHMKLYIFDNSLIISGCNLSNDYFTNRQDRYVLFRDCKDLVDFYECVVLAVADHSLQLRADGETEVLSDLKVHPFKGSYWKYFRHVYKSISNIWSQECKKRQEDFNKIRTNQESQASGPPHSSDTLVFPTLEMGQFAIHYDSTVTKEFFKSVNPGSLIRLASGYFNLTEEYTSCILTSSKAKFEILSAHPTANGFLGAKGFAGAIPSAYTHLAKCFLNNIVFSRRQSQIKLFEYIRPGWTFHGKGLWYYPEEDATPLLSFIGSPNFGWRSVRKDLETQVVIVTQNTELRRKLHEEQERLYRFSHPVSNETFSQPDRYVPFWVRLITPVIKAFF